MITVFTPEITSRSRYIFELYFEELLQVPLYLTTNREIFEHAPGAKLNYSAEDFPFGQLDLRPHLLLFQNGINYQDLAVIECRGERCFFKSTIDSFLPFDPFAAGFYLVSRYEEYLEKQIEPHHRYPSSRSVLYRNQMLEKPVVNQWAQLLAQKIQAHYPDFKYKKPSFDFLTTIDIDNAWAYKNKSWYRVAGASIKALLKGDYKLNQERFQVLTGKEPDPYDTYDYIRNRYSGRNDKLFFFFLLGKRGKYDRNISPVNENFRQLIKGLSHDYHVGVHPSYRSTRHKNELQNEIKTLEGIIGKPVKASRQHFLKLEFPKTYRRLIKAGVKTDYTMGYPDCLGFRAGIASPFHFYDLKNEEKTSLRIMPFQTMDVTLKDYLKLSPDEALNRIKNIMEEVAKSGGTFISLWHNESLSDQGNWKGWRPVFEKTADLAIQLGNGSE